MKKVLIVILLVFLVSCATQPVSQENIEGEAIPMQERESTATDYPPTDVDKFNEVAREIEHWYNQPPRSIGEKHKKEMMNRLLPLNIDQTQKEEYIQKLNSILLADDPVYLEQNQQQQSTQDSTEQSNQHVLRYCSGNGTVPFTSAPIPFDELGFILPKGVMTGHHVTPTDHGYIISKKWTNPGAKREESIDKFANVLAPANGIVLGVDEMPSVFATSTLGDYHITIYHTCTFYTIFIHVNEISEKLKKVLETGTPAEVKAGEVIGRSPGFDFSVFNNDLTLTVVNRESYKGVESMLNSDDLFVHFAEPIKTQLLEKGLRKREPYGGKMDYDVDRTISGNWFVENTNGYQGLPEYNKLIGYWTTHLAFVYNPIDPDVLIVSMGDYGGETHHYAVKGNSPDFTKVTTESGMIEYELVTYDYLDNGKVWDEGHYALLTVQPHSTVEGTVLVQMLEDRKLKFEAFPGKTASQVSEFTKNAKIYER